MKVSLEQEKVAPPSMVIVAMDRGSSDCSPFKACLPKALVSFITSPLFAVDETSGIPNRPAFHQKLQPKSFHPKSSIHNR
jgi:hypothetical protein